MVDALRARAIERLLPPLVHRLNNAVAVFQGVFELGPQASARDRENAHRELTVLSTSLARLSLLARVPSTRPQVVALDQVVQACVLLLKPLAHSWKIEFEARAQPGLTARCDAGLESLVLLTTFEFLQALHGRPPGARHVRIALGATGEEARLVLAARGPVGLPRTAQALLEYAGEHGFPVAAHASARGAAVRVELPLLFEHVLAPERARAPQQRVLLLQEPGQDRELSATVLREQGCDVSEEGSVPPGGSFELVLVDEDLLARDPGALVRIATHVRCARVVRIHPRPRPSELIGLIAR